MKSEFMCNSCNFLALGLEKIDEKPWHISSSNALTGQGLEDGVQWLIEQVRVCVVDSKRRKAST